YLGRPDLTAERFLPDPFAARAGARMYRTGDLVRRLADGTVEYLGRLDSQVKVRGHRVELEEIEATLRRLDGVREAVVVARGQAAGSHTLLACYVLEDDAAEPQRERLAAWLPEHMVPDALVRVTGFPRTLNGKTDRTTLAALPLPDLRARFGAGAPAAGGTPPEAPTGVTRGRTETLVAELARMAAALVGVRPEDIGAHTPLGESGMNSVSFTALSAELRKAYGITEYPTLFYRRGTLHALAEHLWEHHTAALTARFGPAPQAPAAEPAASAGPEVSVDPSGPGAPTGSETPAAPAGREIAVIGMAGRLPGSMDLREFWDHLAAGDDLVGEIPADRWDWRDHPRSRSRWGGFAPHVDRFDAAFFGISPREAELMDPQQRLLLETVWQAVEDAGYRPSE
ncbi:beta-ketoacyl synthase N-terminal-like domain-containing protein, partial [Streptomyces sp. NRRL WC-3549]|uniref:beta-ketoacyl synthase N-terminal-like domain-containing protein n=1 Tax=Streptomyces sp. NRRL WC-3549 TaxID=1463925 RepID=UPI0004C70630